MNERLKQLIEDRIAVLRAEINELANLRDEVKERPARATKSYATATANDEEPKRKGRAPMTDAERSRHSKRMKKIWAMKRAGTYGKE